MDEDNDDDEEEEEVEKKKIQNLKINTFQTNQ
jgi:hypothetical protein